MSSRRASDSSSDGVQLFPFLAVLLCTMGGLLLMLAVFGEHAKRAARAEARAESQQRRSQTTVPGRPPRPTAADVAPRQPAPRDLAAEPSRDEAPDPSDDRDTVEALRAKLANVRATREKVLAALQDAQETRQDQQARLTHAEEHLRRIEHAVAELSVANRLLTAAEEDQQVDQQQAQREVQRLLELIEETESDLQELREQAPAERSFAIIPYRGQNGTHRRPVYIECTGEGATLQPEGLKFTWEELYLADNASNPLAAAVRSAHEELNSRPRSAHQPEPPDAYPLLIVRPSSAEYRQAAFEAVSKWNGEFGYEFVPEETPLSFGEPDPKLSRVMAHAVEQARQRQEVLAAIAPREYRMRSLGGGGQGLGGGVSFGDGNGYASNGDGGGSEGGYGGRYAAAGFAASSDGVATGNGDSPAMFGNDGASVGGGGGHFADYGGLGGTGQQNNGAGGSSYAAGGQSTAGGEIGNHAGSQPQATLNGAYASLPANGGGNAAGGATGGTPGGAPGSAAGRGSTAPGATSGQSGNSANSQTAEGSGGAGATGNPFAATGASGGSGNVGAATSSAAVAQSVARSGDIGQSPSDQSTAANVGQSDSAADAAGLQPPEITKSAGLSPISRPIRIAIDREGAVVAPGTGGSLETAVTFHQSPQQVLDALASAVRSQVEDWGLAGRGMYWRPRLILEVEPGAEPLAQKLSDVISRSGVDVEMTGPRPQPRLTRGGADGSPR